MDVLASFVDNPGRGPYNPGGNASMIPMDTSKVRENLSDVLKAVRDGERVLLRRHGKAVAAIVPVEDLALLRVIEDRMDRKAAREARADYEANGGIPLEQLKAELGL
jgi:prevent-host-death family protein